MLPRMILVLACILGLAATRADAAGVVFDSKTDFMNSTASANATGSYPVQPSTSSITVGDVTFNGAFGPGQPGPTTLQLNEWTSRLPGNELAIDGVENFDVVLNIVGPVYALGWDFVEPEFDPNIGAPFVDSTFEVSLFNGSTLIDTFTFTRPNDIVAFVGYWGDGSFSRAEIREIVGANENEFFGAFYIGMSPMQTVPVESPSWSVVKELFRTP